MSQAQLQPALATPDTRAPSQPRSPAPSVFGLIGIVLTMVVAALLAWSAWSYYVYTPWTRDGTVRAYTAQVAPEISGRVTDVLVSDNQAVHKGDVLFRIDDRDYRIAVEQAQASLAHAAAQFRNSQAEAARRNQLNDLAVTLEERQTYQSNADAAQASYQGAQADLEKAKLNLERTEVRSPVNGYVTNLLLQAGTYATNGQAAMTLVDSDSFWVTAYFEETQIARIRVGDSASVVLMGFPRTSIQGHVASFGRGITDPNAAPGVAGLPSVNPVFTWVRLAQRVPIRIEINRWPDDFEIAAGMTASVNVQPTTGNDKP